MSDEGEIYRSDDWRSAAERYVQALRDWARTNDEFMEAVTGTYGEWTEIMDEDGDLDVDSLTPGEGARLGVATNDGVGGDCLFRLKWRDPATSELHNIRRD